MIQVMMHPFLCDGDMRAVVAMTTMISLYCIIYVHINAS